MINTEKLILRSSLILYKFTEGCEDYSEFTELYESLKEMLPSIEDNNLKRIVENRINEYYERLQNKNK